MRAAYDVVVIGGGHNGLTAAYEFARAGWSVLVIEALAGVGGCATTTEPLLPGFRHSPHANTFLFADLMPDAIKPDILGLNVIQPTAQLGVAFADGRAPVILHRPDALDRTFANLAVYSRADARNYTEIKRRSETLGPLIRQGLYAAPDVEWFSAQRTTVERVFSGFQQRSKFGTSTARRLIDDLFETPEVRLLLYSLTTETGVALEETGSDLAFLSYSLWIAGRWRVPIGGMGAYSEALHQLVTSSGVDVVVSRRVAKVDIEDRCAVAVRMTSGERVRATKAVLAAAPILHLFDDLVDSHAISQPERAEIESFRTTSVTSIGTSFFCLEKPPHYKSAKRDRDIDACLKTIIGFDTPADALAQDVDVRAGRLPRPAGVVRVHSVWDSALAPAGRHVAAVDGAFPATEKLDHETWRLVESAFPTALFQTWRSYCSDEAQTAPIAMSCECSARYERRMLVRIGSQRYRTSVERLYLGGSGVYPGGGVHGACGGNAARTVLTDAGVSVLP